MTRPTDKRKRRSTPASSQTAQGGRKRAPAAEAPQDLLRQLAARVAALESAASATPAAGGTPPHGQGGEEDPYWILNRLARSGTRGGEVAYSGAVTTPTGEQYLWQRQAGAARLFQQDWTALTGVLAALGHPVRLQLLHHLLHGRRSKAELEQIPGLGTTGQLYHHLKALQEAGWVRSLERGTYGVPGERVVPLLAILTAAAG